MEFQQKKILIPVIKKWKCQRRPVSTIQETIPKDPPKKNLLNVISSECSSHFKVAYNNYKSAEKQNSANQENKLKTFNSYNENHQSLDYHHSNRNDDKLYKVIRRFSQIPTIVNQEDDTKANTDNHKYEKDNIDVFDYHEESRDIYDKDHISLNDVPGLWKKDRRHSADFLSPIHLNSLNKKHLRTASNPESFKSLRELSSRLQVERTSGPGKMGFDRDYGGSDDDGDYENDNETENLSFSPDTDCNLDSTRLSPQLNKILEKQRHLSTDNTGSRDKLITNLAVHNKNPSKGSRRLSVDNFLSSDTLPIERTKRLSKKPSYLTLPKIKSEFLINQTTKNTHRDGRERLNSDTPEYYSQTGKRKTSLIMEGKLRRASRIISNIDRQKISASKDRQKSLTQNDHNNENSIEELRKCRYLRTTYDPDHLESCPCINCEKSVKELSPAPSVVDNC